MRISHLVEPPRRVGGRPNPDSGPLTHSGARDAAAGRNEQLLTPDEVDAVVGAANAEGLGEPRRTRAQQSIVSDAAMLSHQLNALDRLGRSKEHRAPLAIPAGHDVHAEVHSIREIDVQEAGGTEHHLGPRGQATERMARLIVFLICLRLDDPSDQETLG